MNTPTKYILCILSLGHLSDLAVAQTYDPGTDPRRFVLECQTIEKHTSDEDLDQRLIERWGHKRYRIEQTSNGPFADIRGDISRQGTFKVSVFDRDSDRLILEGAAEGRRSVSILQFSMEANSEVERIHVTVDLDGIQIKRSSIQLYDGPILQARCSDLMFFD